MHNNFPLDFTYIYMCVYILVGVFTGHIMGKVIPKRGKKWEAKTLKSYYSFMRYRIHEKSPPTLIIS